MNYMQNVLPSKQPKKPLLILGNGGHAAVVRDIALLLGYEIAGHVDYSADELSGYDLKSYDLTVAIGHQQRRWQLVQKILKLGGNLPVLAHPTAVIAQSASIMPGTVIGALAMVGPESKIDSACILNNGAQLDHHGQLGQGVHLAPGAILAGNVTCGDHVMIGVGAKIINNLTIGNNTVVGAGATVLENLPADVVAYGTPCRVIRPQTAQYVD